MLSLTSENGKIKTESNETHIQYLYVCVMKTPEQPLSQLLAKVISELGPGPYLSAIFVQENRRRHKRKAQEGQHGGSPLRSQVAVHIRGKQRKGGSDETADESVRRQGGIGFVQVDVDEVDDGGHEDHDDLSNVLACVKYWKI
jgi:hypothetical protein